MSAHVLCSFAQNSIRDNLGQTPYTTQYDRAAEFRRPPLTGFPGIAQVFNSGRRTSLLNRTLASRAHSTRARIDRNAPAIAGSAANGTGTPAQARRRPSNPPANSPHALPFCSLIRARRLMFKLRSCRCGNGARGSTWFATAFGQPTAHQRSPAALQLTSSLQARPQI